MCYMQMKHEGWRDLHAEAEALIEEASTKAEGHRKPDAPAAWPKRDRRSVAAQTVSSVRCLQGATHKELILRQLGCCLLSLPFE